MNTQKNKHYIGVDLGDKKHEICVLDSLGEILVCRNIANDRKALATLVKKYPGGTVIMECGSHSPWISRYLESLGMKVLVANPRKVRAIYQNERKSDVRDAEMLAQIGRLDPKLLHPIKHGSEENQQDLVVIKMRDTLVRNRVDRVNAVRDERDEEPVGTEAGRFIRFSNFFCSFKVTCVSSRNGKNTKAPGYARAS